MSLPAQVYEVIPLNDGSFVIRVFMPIETNIGSVFTQDGRKLVAMKSYPSVNAMVADLKVLMAAPPITG